MRVYFDVRNETISLNIFIFALGSLSIYALGLSLFRNYKNKHISSFLLYLAINIFFYYIEYQNISYYQKSLELGNYSIVEGSIEGIGYNERGFEEFKVKGVFFEYGPRHSVVYHKSGVLKNGMYVKIYYISMPFQSIENGILRIELDP
jgi:hypothetical protein